jgi:signal transduction histidine kinase
VRPADWFRAPRHLLAWFVLVTALPTIALFVLGWQLLGNEADLDVRHRQRLVSEASQVAGDLRQYLDVLSRPGLPPDGKGTGTLWVTLSRTAVSGHAGVPLLFVPSIHAPPPDDPRALALVQAAGEHRESGRFDRALSLYGEMARLTDEVSVFGGPAGLEGSLARLRLLHEPLGRHEQARSEARQLRADLERARWAADRVSFETAWLKINEVTGEPRPYPPAFALAQAVDRLALEWLAPGTPPGWNGRRAEWAETRHLTTHWSSAEGELSVRVIPIDAVAADLSEVWNARNLQVTFIAADGRPILGDDVSDRGVLTTLSESGLPWSLRTASIDPRLFVADELWRRRQLQAVLGLAVLLMLIGAYFVARAVRREFAVAQLQKDFVSAVSHEFRTPLTSMGHLVELLKGDRPLDDTRRRRYYDAIEQEARRLRGFVDTLLDFGRVESGVARYEMERIDPAVLMRDVIDRFRQDPSSGGRDVELSVPPAVPAVTADPAAVGLVVRNLLENAVKYAPGLSPVRVELGGSGPRVTLTVRDDGPGIPKDEQQMVFEKFVRGTAARSARIKGTGVGLALSRQIARAHGGDLTLQSEPGRGAAFTVTLPAAPEVERPEV